jgi:hypothetical protein
VYLGGMSKNKLQAYEEPHEDAVADRALYARLQQEAQAREDLALCTPLSRLIGAPVAKPQYVGGRWVMS